eukprot:m.24108 g.24108  ORF g.24108 m.24108 type:complete len:196 (-) comp6027_c0_seq1:1257-1844(-)
MVATQVLEVGRMFTVQKTFIGLHHVSENTPFACFGDPFRSPLCNPNHVPKRRPSSESLASQSVRNPMRMINRNAFLHIFPASSFFSLKPPHHAKAVNPRCAIARASLTMTQVHAAYAALRSSKHHSERKKKRDQSGRSKQTFRSPHNAVCLLRRRRHSASVGAGGTTTQRIRACPRNAGASSPAPRSWPRNCRTN